MQRIAFEHLSRLISPEELHSGSIFGALSRDAILFLLRRGRIWDVRAGDAVFNYGDRGDSFFLVCSGSLHFLKQKDGHRFHTRTIEFGQEVGFVAMIALVRRQGTAIANRDCLLLEIDSALFSELHEAHPADFGLMTLNLARDMARQVCRLGDLLVEHSISY